MEVPLKRLKVRKPPFTFPAEDTPYLWQPANPDFSEMCNAISFLAPAFERYIVVLVQQAQSRLKGTPMEQEAEDFLRQEAQHARMHRRHVAALVKKYPGLVDLQPDIDRAYTELVENESLEFNLAYVADIEATFTPLFGMMLNNEKSLFRGGANPVASLFIWHFMEEIEHRSSALGIYNTAVASPWYRVRVLPKVMRHVTGLLTATMDTLACHVPRADRGEVSGRAINLTSPVFRDIPRRELAAMIFRLALSQAPFHRPEHQPIPEFAADWLDAEVHGRDITRWYATT
jgi:predicted metal-dependent hydrolase